MLSQIWKVVWMDEAATSGSLQLLDGDKPFSQLVAQLPQCAYTTLRTYHGHYALRLEAHFQRLEQTARLEGMTLALPRAGLRAVMRQIISEDQPDLRLRVMLDLEQQPGDLYIAALPLAIPSQAAYQSGVWVVSVGLRRTRPKAKLTRFMLQADNARQNLPSGAHEGIMLDEEGRLLEGLSSNIFAVRDGKIWTAEEGVLSGISRALLLDEIERLGIPVNFEGALYQDLASFDEAFITSASRAVLPVRQIDERVIGKGYPGEITSLLMEVYDRRVEDELEFI